MESKENEVSVRRKKKGCRRQWMVEMVDVIMILDDVDDDDGRRRMKIRKKV